VNTHPLPLFNYLTATLSSNDILLEEQVVLASLVISALVQQRNDRKVKNFVQKKIKKNKKK